MQTSGSITKRVSHIHCVGIGGAGMSGIAAVLHRLGFEVTGSDIKASLATQRLMAQGVNTSEK